MPTSNTDTDPLLTGAKLLNSLLNDCKGAAEAATRYLATHN